jgi:ABC transporter DrrB family efflux protein
MTATAVVPTTTVDVDDRDVTFTPPTRTASVAATTASVASRTIKKFYRTPQLVVVSTIQGAMFLLIFRYVFGGAINSGPIPYVDFLVPGYVVTSVLFVGMMTTSGVAEDMEDGFFDRLRSLPVRRPALLTGRAVADTAVAAWSLAVTVAIGFAVGFRLHTDVWSGLAAFGLCVVFAFAFEWMFICLGLFAGNAQGAQGMSMLVFPLTFVSSAYVPVDSMPSWLQPIAEHQPITIMVDAVRALCLGDPAAAGLGQSTAHYVVLSLVWSVALVAVFAPIAVMRYRRG